MNKLFKVKVQIQGTIYVECEEDRDIEEVLESIELSEAREIGYELETSDDQYFIFIDRKNIKEIERR